MCGVCTDVHLGVADIPPSVEWAGDRVEVIDQTQLPGELHIRTLTSIADVTDAIRRLVVRGAPAIGLCGAFALVLALDHARPKDVKAARNVLAKAAAEVGSARPTAVNLTYALTRVVRAASQGNDPADIRQRALSEAECLCAEDRESCRLIGENGRQEIGGLTRILTHCNTGRLATAGWGTALGIVYAKKAHDEEIHVLMTESRPLLQGARLTAWELTYAHIPSTLLVDGAAASAMAQGLVDAVVVGCDRVARNGDTANKVGTYTLALAAQAHHIPFYVAGPVSSFDSGASSGSDIVIEQRPAEEVLFPEGPRVDVWNPAFDITNATLITAFITDVGVLRPPYETSLPLAWKSIVEEVIG